MDVNDKVRDLQEHAAKTRRLPEFGHWHRRGDWPHPLIAPYEPTPDQLCFLQSQVAGHRWHVGRCLSGDQDFSAACSCGWGCTETGSVGAILRQVEEHLDAVREICGGRLSTRAPARDERDVGQGELRPDQRARELRAAMEGQQRRLSQALRHSTDLLSASADQADRVAAALEAGKWAKHRSICAKRRDRATQGRACEGAAQDYLHRCSGPRRNSRGSHLESSGPENPSSRRHRRIAADGRRSQRNRRHRPAGWAHVASLIPTYSGAGVLQARHDISRAYGLAARWIKARMIENHVGSRSDR